MIPAHFICWNHFYSFLSVQTRVQETRRSGPRESRRALSRRNHFSSFLLAETGAGHEVRRSKSPRVAALCFRGNHFYSFLPGETGPREARRSSSPGALHFFCGNHFPSFLPADTNQPRQPVDWRRWGHHKFFPREPLFLVPFVSGRL